MSSILLYHIAIIAENSALCASISIVIRIGVSPCDAISDVKDCTISRRMTLLVLIVSRCNCPSDSTLKIEESSNLFDES